MMRDEPSMKNLDGRVAVVTGGAAGIGFAIARRMVASGARVCLWDRDEAALAKSDRRVQPTEERLRRAPRHADQEVEVVDEERPGDQLHDRADEHPPQPVHEEPAVVVPGEDRPPLVGSHHDAEDVAGLPDACAARHGVP